MQPKLRFKEFNKDWVSVALNRLTTFERGKFSARPRNDARYFGGDIPFVQTGDVAQSRIFLDKFNQTLNNDGLKVSKQFPKGTILITIAANIGDTAILMRPMACPDSLVGARVNQTVADTYFVKSLIDLSKAYLESQATQNAQKNINLQVLNSLSAYVPELVEQTKIANFLSAVDQKITILEKQQQAWEQYKQGMMQKLFSGELRFKDENGEDFPEWGCHSLGDLGYTYNGLTGKNSDDFGYGKPFVTYKQVFNRPVINLDDCSFVNITLNDKQNSVKQGDVIFTMSSETANEIAISSVLLENPQEKIYLNSFCFGFRFTNNSYMWPQFTVYLFRGHDFRKDVSILAQGTTRYNISKIGMLKLTINLPCLEEQKKIASYLVLVDKKIDNISQQLVQMKTWKQGLLQQMFV